MAGWSDEGASPIATDAYLMLGDSAAALNMTRFFLDRAMPSSLLLSTIGNVAPASGALWPRMMLKRADLAAVMGSRDEARIWYARLSDLWDQADPELQPTLMRIRRALATLK